MFPIKPRDAVEMRAVIILLCSETGEDMCRRVITDVRVRIQEAVRQNGRHVEHVLKKGNKKERKNFQVLKNEDL
jgi:hypothetical protein